MKKRTTREPCGTAPDTSPRMKMPRPFSSARLLPLLHLARIAARRAPHRATLALGVTALGALSGACHDYSLDAVVTSQAAATPALQRGGPMDVLFVVDDSSSMADKQAYLVDAAGAYLRRLAEPRCIDDAGQLLGASVAGACAAGHLEFPPVTDMHVGILSTSLGAGGAASVCGDEAGNTRAHLLARGDAVRPTLHTDSNVFSWNTRAVDAPPVAQLIQDVETSIQAMGEKGCGYESQLETWYRFLVQPEPYDRVVVASEAAHYEGVDSTLLDQRKAFLRPDSTVSIVLLTDENDASIDPMSFGAHAWMFGEVSPHLRPGTAACASDPTSPSCRSCFLSAAANDPNCAASLDDEGDPPEVRFFHPKQRFGYDPRFPIARYVAGLTNARVPDRNGEHPVDDATGLPSFDYVGEARCTSPLFAAELPDGTKGQELCNLVPGPRLPSQVFFLLIGGAPHQLLQTDPSAAAGPVKESLDPADYTRLLGADPEAYRFDGIDPHMLESLTPRAGIGDPDPIVRHEWNTQGANLEYACTFPLVAPRDCASDPFCACAADAQGSPVSPDNPLCDATTPTDQVYAGAFPAERELLLAQAIGPQSVVGSICPAHLATTAPPAPNGAADVADPLFGYQPAASDLIDRMAGR